MAKKKLSSAENTLSILATFVLVIGIFGSILLFFALGMVTSPYGYGSTFTFQGLPYAIICLVSSLITWALFKILVEISYNIRTANSSLNWEKKFVVLIKLGKQEEAKELLYTAIMESEFIADIHEADYAPYQTRLLADLNSHFKPYLQAIGDESFDYKLKEPVYRF